MTDKLHVRDLINRLARLDSARGWAGNLNPTQLSMLGYLAQANRFSRSPSHVAEYLGTTRGTATQSLKSLLQKGYLTELRSEVDKRVISYELTKTGQLVARTPAPLQTALASLGHEERQVLQRILNSLLLDIITRNKGREFGFCRDCIHHQNRDGAPYCALLTLALTPDEAGQICHEHVSP